MGVPRKTTETLRLRLRRVKKTVSKKNLII